MHPRLTAILPLLGERAVRADVSSVRRELAFPRPAG